MSDFVFFGAGHARYTDHATLYVGFHSEPSAKEKTAIEAACPALLSEREWEGDVLRVQSASGINAAIAEAYSDSPEPLKAFNEHILAWLIEARTSARTQCVLRPIDAGTELNQQHHEYVWDMTSYIDELEQSLDGPDGPDGSGSTGGTGGPRQQFYRALLDCALQNGQKLNSRQYKKLGLPTKKADIQAYVEQQANQLLDDGTIPILGENCVDAFVATLKNQLDENNAEHRKHVLGALPKTPSLVKHRDLRSFLFNAALDAGDIDACKLFAGGVQGAKFAGEACAKGEFELAKALFIPSDDPGLPERKAVTVLLYNLKQDNTGNPVNPEVNRYFIERCIGHAEHYPWIYHAIACLHIEMGEFARAYELLELGLDKRLDTEFLYRVLTTDAFYDDFKEATNIMSIIGPKGRKRS